MNNFKFLIFVLIVITSCKKNIEVKPVIQDIKQYVFASGQIEWDNAYNLTAQTDGTLTMANFDIGDKVTAGTILAIVDNKSNQINTQTSTEQLAIANENLTDRSPQLQQLEQNIVIAESKYNQDKIQAERYQRLLQSQSVAKVEVENMQLLANNSLSNLNALKSQRNLILQQAKQQQIQSSSQVRINKVNEGYNKIKVTVSGTVIKKLKTNGDYVRKGEVIATIADEKAIEVVLNVDENNIGKVKLGQEVFVRLNTNKEKVLEGKISEILSAFDTPSQSYICKVALDSILSQSIYGTQLEANIFIMEKKQALLIPRVYLGYGNKVIVKGKKDPVQVKTGIVSSDYVEILQGIGKDDVIEIGK